MIETTINKKPLFVSLGSVGSMELFKVLFEHQNEISFGLQTIIGVLTVAYMIKQLLRKHKTNN